MEAAETLRAALPDTAMQNDFAVYDMGFYLHHQDMVGGIPEVMAKTIDDHVTHSYYLVFGREMDREGRIKKVWVEVELPNTAQFCYWEDGSFSHLKFMVDIRANAAKGLSMTARNAIFDAMENGISYMADRVDQLVECCGSSLRQQCECGWSFGDVRDFTNTGGFFNISASVLPVESTQDTACICWNEYETEAIEVLLDSGMVVVSSTVEEISFSDSLSVSLEVLTEILLGVGDAVNLRNQSFFGAITDQSVFCNFIEPPLALRSTNILSLSDVENGMASSDVGIWINILHHNGVATFSLFAKGIDQRLIEMALSEDCLNTSEWHICAFNNVIFGYKPYSVRPNGIVIHGMDNSSITIRNDWIRMNIHLPMYQFYGQWEIDMSRVAFGIETNAGLSGGVAYGAKTLFCYAHTMFLAGDYAGYFYKYAGSEFSLRLNTSAEIVRIAGGSFFIAFNDAQEDDYINSYKPSGFDGEYTGFGASLSFKIILGGLNFDIQHIRSTQQPDPFWYGFSLGISGQWGPQYGFFKGGSIEASWTPFGELRLLTEEIPTKDRSYRDIASNYFYVFKLVF